MVSETGKIIGAAVALALWCAGPAGAEIRFTRNLVVVPYNDNKAVDVGISTSKATAKPGETIEICFKSSAAGQVTLWDIGTDGSVGRIFPNARMGEGAAAKEVEAGRNYCAGKQGDPFRFQVGAPAGIEDLYLVWTADASGQPVGASFPSAEAFSHQLDFLRARPAGQWATAKTSFDVVVDAPAPPPLPPKPTPVPPPVAANDATPRIFIFASGANVKPLTKSNQDAHMFADNMAKMFAVPADNIRLVENVHKPEFKAAMSWLASVARPQDFVFVYYSGHGYRIPGPPGSGDDGSDNALVPYEFNDPGYKVTDFIRNTDLVEMVKPIRTQKVILVMDACFSGGLYRSLTETMIGAKPKYFTPSDDIVRQLAAGGPATRDVAPRTPLRAQGVLFAAAKPDQTAAELKMGSLFTLALVDEMQQSSTGTLQSVFEKVATEVDDVSKHKQTPVSVGDRTVAEKIDFAPSP